MRANTGDFRFPREERLKKRTEIRRVFKEGKTASCFGAKLFYAESAVPTAERRAAFTFPRKFGNAVQRNRRRRLMREAYRRLRPCLRTGFDLVFLAYPGVSSLGEADSQVRTLARRAGLLL